RGAPSRPYPRPFRAVLTCGAGSLAPHGEEPLSPRNPRPLLRRTDLEQEAGDETNQGQGLSERDTQEHGGAQLASHLRLTCHSLSGLACDVTHTDRGTDCCEAVADGAEALELGDSVLS